MREKEITSATEARDNVVRAALHLAGVSWNYVRHPDDPNLLIDAQDLLDEALDSYVEARSGNSNA